MKLCLVVCFILSVSSLAHSNNLINSKYVFSQNSCFSGSNSDFHLWREKVVENINKKYKKEKMVKMKIAEYDANFSATKFDHYKTSMECSTFNYSVDGNLVRGYVLKPKNATNKIPVLIYNRGGSGELGVAGMGEFISRLFPIAEQGFIIIGSQYRGMFLTNNPIKDELGGADVKDVEALFPLIKHIEGANDKKVGMFGHSRGGMQTFLALKNMPKIKAVAVISGNSDLQSVIAMRPYLEKNVYEKIIPNYADNKIEELRKRSVVEWVDQLPKKVPILLLHGSKDVQVSVKDSIKLDKLLEENKLTHKLVIYPDDDHGLNNNAANSTAEIVAWFQQYL